MATTLPASAAEKMTPQQQRMADCNASATAGKYAGDQRKQFMSSCLKGETGGAAATKTAAAPPSSKEKACMSEADQRKLAGAARTSFVKKCAGS
jgi:hypothetical protein